ncbi:MAG TPA: oligosaccharide flippase family protein [Candidatus Saccharimonadales bacterium]
MLQRLLKQINSSTFLRYNAIFFMGSVSVGALNYFYYPIIGRLLQPAAFGEVQALVSLFLQLTIFLNVFSMITISIIANYKKREEAHAVIFELEKAALLASIIALLVVALANEPLRQAFHFNSGFPIILIALAVTITVPLTFRSAFLRAIKKFGQTSIAGILAAIGKLGLSVLFIFMGFNTAGAIGGIVAAQVIALTYAALKAKKGGLRYVSDRYFHLPSYKRLVPELRYAALVLIGSFVMTMLFSVDVLVVKYLFDAETAGLYAGIATVARIIYFLTASIVQVLLPSVSLQQSSQQNRAVLFKSLILIFAIGGPTLLVCMLFPELCIQLLMGSNYLAFAGLLPLLSLAIFIISVMNLLVMYFIALHRRGIAIVAIIGAVVTLGLMVMYHSDVQAIVSDLLLGSLTMMLVLSAWLWITKPNRKRKRTTSDTEAAHIDYSSRTQ